MIVSGCFHHFYNKMHHNVGAYGVLQEKVDKSYDGSVGRMRPFPNGQNKLQRILNGHILRLCVRQSQNKSPMCPCYYGLSTADFISANSTAQIKCLTIKLHTDIDRLKKNTVIWSNLLLVEAQTAGLVLIWATFKCLLKFKFSVGIFATCALHWDLCGRCCLRPYFMSL